MSLYGFHFYNTFLLYGCVHIGHFFELVFPCTHSYLECVRFTNIHFVRLFVCMRDIPYTSLPVRTGNLYAHN